LNKTVWAIGMNVLNRMDLVVDGKSGVAYVHPRPPPGPAYPGVNRPGAAKATRIRNKNWNWTLADDVRLQTDNLYVLSGKYHMVTLNFDAALADYNVALSINSNSAQAFSRRGVVRQILGDFPGAVADYGQVIRLNPDGADWERLYRETLLWRLAWISTDNRSPKCLPVAGLFFRGN